MREITEKLAKDIRNKIDNTRFGKGFVIYITPEINHNLQYENDRGFCDFLTEKFWGAKFMWLPVIARMTLFQTGEL